jgi:putative membrane protein
MLFPTRISKAEVSPLDCIATGEKRQGEHLLSGLLQTCSSAPAAILHSAQLSDNLAAEASILVLGPGLGTTRHNPRFSNLDLGRFNPYAIHKEIKAMNIVKKGLTGLAGALLLAGISVAQSNPPSTNDNMQASANGGVSASDRKFMDKAAQGGMAEVELGQLAEQNGQSENVKAFGKRMVDDHSKANDQLKQLAAQKGVSLPSSLDAKDQAVKDKLSKLQGAAFDKAYMKDMVADHKQDVAEFKHESMAAHDPELKSWAGQTLPTLESHLQEAEKIAPSTMGGNMSKGNGMSAESH